MASVAYVRSLLFMAKAQQPTGISYASCSVSVAPLRRDPSHRAEQTSQILFGERVEVLEHNPETDWSFVKMQWDGYEGWCKAGQLMAIGFKAFKKETTILNLTNSGALVMDHGLLHLPAGSELAIQKGVVPVGIGTGKFKGKKRRIEKTEPSGEAVLSIATAFLHAPYQWGGRTFAGIDCSALVQIAFKLCGTRACRDAVQQVTLGEEVHFLAELRAGDLAFFDNAEGRIVHVGILIAPDEIIHATDTAGRVVVDRIDSAGIISRTMKRRTHQLRMIRRLIP